MFRDLPAPLLIVIGVVGATGAPFTVIELTLPMLAIATETEVFVAAG
jgi:hypothetical protein